MTFDKYNRGCWTKNVLFYSDKKVDGQHDEPEKKDAAE